MPPERARASLMRRGRYELFCWDSGRVGYYRPSGIGATTIGSRSAMYREAKRIGATDFLVKPARAVPPQPEVPMK